MIAGMISEVEVTLRLVVKAGVKYVFSADPEVMKFPFLEFQFIVF
jgi:hypothetical protein